VCSRAKAVLAAAAPPRPAPAWAAEVDETATETDVEHYALELEVTPSLNRLDGSNAITVTSLVDGLRRFRFWLSDRLDISRVTVNADVSPWERLDEATVEVALDPPRHRGEDFVVTVTYGGYPALDTPGISFETRDGHPEVTTRSEPWYAYIWWPVKEDSQDKATADITLIVPQNLVAVSNGTLVDTRVDGGKARFHWRTRYQTAPYLFFASVTNYNTFSDAVELGGRLMPLDFHIRPEEDTTAHRNLWLRVKDMLQAFGSLFGSYPFAEEKYGIYQFSHGGMEHQTCSGQTGFSEMLSSHELAHQWWGDMVTCATWHDMWLNEGFATYAEALWLEHEAGQDGAEALRSAMADRRPDDPSGTVYVSDISSASDLFTQLTYQKGAWVLHMLRHVLGDEAFFSMLRRYGSEHAYATVSTEDLRAVAEEEADEDLGWFFDEWVYGGGAPSYDYGWREDRVLGRPYLEVYVRQAQAASGPRFRMPLDLEIVTATGQHEASVLADAVEEHYLLPVDGAVSSVQLDPGGWILTTRLSLIGFVEGPPKIVETTPAPGSVVVEGHVGALLVTFHEDVIADASDFALAGAHAGPVPLSFDYAPATTTVRLVPQGRLVPDDYTLIISDAVIGAASAQPLDGEIGGGSGGGVLPSGDGSPGGRAVVPFSVKRPPRRVLRGRR
jgi:aminopeptidase N